MTGKKTSFKWFALLLAIVFAVSAIGLCVCAADGETEDTSNGLLLDAANGETTTMGAAETTTTAAAETTTTGAAETTTTAAGETTTTTAANTSVVTDITSLLIALGIIVAAALVVFILWLFVPKFKERFNKFWKDYNAEFKKLVWPTKQQLVKNSLVVIVTIIIFAVVLMLVDLGLTQGIRALKDLIDLIRPVS